MTAANSSSSAAAERGPIVQPYFDKWRQREPELALIDTFLPPALRLKELCWHSLLHEFEHSLFGAQEASVAEMKLRWFVQDLAAADKARHPLAKALFREVAHEAERWQALPWAEWLSAALVLNEHTQSPASVATWLQAWQPYGRHLAVIEASLLGRPLAAEVLVPLLAGRHLVQQLREHGESAALPLDLWLVGGDAAADTMFGPHSRPRWQQLSGHLSAVWQPVQEAGGAVRLLQARHLWRQFQSLCRNGALPAQRFFPWQRLWDTWQASRTAAS